MTPHSNAMNYLLTLHNTSLHRMAYWVTFTSLAVTVASVTTPQADKMYSEVCYLRTSTAHLPCLMYVHVGHSYSTYSLALTLGMVIKQVLNKN